MSRHDYWLTQYDDHGYSYGVIHGKVVGVKGQLVELSPISGDDDYAMLALWSATPTGAYSSGTPQFLTSEEVRSAVTAQGMSFLMVRTLDGRTVGAVNWQRMTYSGHFTIGNVVGDSELWGVGYGVESVILLLEHLFHAQNAHRVHLLTGAFNLPMIKIFTQGFVRIEGILRDYFFLDGEYHDAVVGSILRDEYYKAVRASGMVPRDMIDSGDKGEARRLLRDYLVKNPIVG
jgi:RimJ/RimL family protein N-acetyltransferase